MDLSKKIIICAVITIFLISLGMGEGFSQTKPKEEKGPEIRLGEIYFQVRKLGSPPSQYRMLEIQIEVLNRSPKLTVSPNSIKVLVTPKEIKLSEGTRVTEFTLTPEETFLNLPLPPATGRVLIIGFSLLETKPEFITFEIQMNPPDGEKKTVKWEGNEP